MFRNKTAVKPDNQKNRPGYIHVRIMNKKYMSYEVCIREINNVARTQLSEAVRHKEVRRSMPPQETGLDDYFQSTFGY